MDGNIKKVETIVTMKTSKQKNLRKSVALPKKIGQRQLTMQQINN